MAELKEKLRGIGRAFLNEVQGTKGVEFTIFFSDGTRINYNSRNDEEETE